VPSWAAEEDVLAFLRALAPERFELSSWTRGMLLAAEPDLSERLYPGWQGVGFHHPEAGYVCAVYPAGERPLLLFEHGAALEDPDGVLVGDGSQTRSLPLDLPSDDLAPRIREFLGLAVAERLLTRGR
jgi:hypothetical protein